MNENPKSKSHCFVCDCLVVLDGHELRCKVKSVRWSDRRVASWLGDTIHRMDVQMAVQMMQIQPETWEFRAQTYTSNLAMANYMVRLGYASEGRSAHSLGTDFESMYHGQFRVEYLQFTFPGVCERLLSSWQPPELI